MRLVERNISLPMDGKINVAVGNLIRYLTSNTLTPHIEITIDSAKAVSGKANYRVLVGSDDGRMTTFMGFTYNSASGSVVLGYNDNNKEYISLFSLVEFFNNAISPGDPIFSLDSVNYLVESFKLDFRNFDFRSYIQTLRDRFFSDGVYSGSVLLNAVQDLDVKTTSDKNKSTSYLVSKNEFVMEILILFFSGLNNKVGDLGRSVFGNFISETKFDPNLEKNMSQPGYTRNSGYEERFIKAIRDEKIDPLLVRELSSVGLGIKSRSGVFSYKTHSSDDRNICGILSSWSHLDEWSGDYSRVTDEKINSYNLIDILRSVDEDGNLFFYHTLGLEKGMSLTENLINKYMEKIGLQTELTGVGTSNFVDFISNYKKSPTMLRDMGSNYARLVTDEQKDFTSFSTRSISNYGRIVKKATDLMISKF